MQTSIKTAFAAVFLGAFTLAPVAAVHAQEAVKTTTTVSPSGTSVTQTTSEGTIQEFTPGGTSIVVKSAAGPATYRYSKTTTFVDEAGNTVSAETIKTGAPTTVYYTTENGQPVVSKVVVRRVTAPVTPVVTKTESTETTTTTTTKH